MKLREYLQHRGGNNITIAEANAIGIVIHPGWPQKFAEHDIPEHLADAVKKTKSMPWAKRRKFLRESSFANRQLPREENVLLRVKSLLLQASEEFPNDPYKAFGFVDIAMCILETVDT